MNINKHIRYLDSIQNLKIWNKFKGGQKIWKLTKLDY